MAQAQDEFITHREAAIILGVHESYLRRKTSTGQYKNFPQLGRIRFNNSRALRMLRADVVALKQSLIEQIREQAQPVPSITRGRVVPDDVIERFRNLGAVGTVQALESM